MCIRDRIKDMKTNINKEFNNGSWKATKDFSKIITKMNIYKDTKKIILEILKLAKEKNWVVISDECYERLVFDGEHTVSKKLAIDNNIDANIVTCMSMSKTYAMTGWRIGYAAGPNTIIKAIFQKLIKV